MGFGGEPRFSPGAAATVLGSGARHFGGLLRRRVGDRTSLGTGRARPGIAGRDGAAPPPRMDLGAPRDVAGDPRRARAGARPAVDRCGRCGSRLRPRDPHVLHAAHPAPTGPSRGARPGRRPPLSSRHRSERASADCLDRSRSRGAASGLHVRGLHAREKPPDLPARELCRLRGSLRPPRGDSLDEGLERHLRTAPDGPGGAAPGPLHARRKDRGRGDGRRLPREARAAAPPHGHQDPAARARRPDGPRPIRARSPDDVASDLAAHRFGLRLRPHARWPLLLRDGVPRRDRSRRAGTARRAHAARPGRPRSRPGVRGARRGAPRRPHSSRREARQHPAVRAGRAQPTLPRSSTSAS